jgi:MaoC dehydratase-like protein
MTTEEVNGNPYLRAAAGMLPGRRRPRTLPDRAVVSHSQTIDRDHLAAYSRICEFRLSDTLPATYPHVLAFPLAMHLMSAADFPFPIVGMVHIANRITLRRPIRADEQLDLSVRAAHLRDHERGRQLDIVATATVDGEDVWDGLSTYLKIERRGERRDQGERTPPPATAIWRVPTTVGAQYAAVSGDRNPIHTSRIGARLFGFPQRIAHGMWTAARCMAALEGRLPDRYTMDVTFKAPVLLPSRVEFTAVEAEDGWEFGLRSRKPHLAGQVTHP